MNEKNIKVKAKTTPKTLNSSLTQKTVLKGKGTVKNAAKGAKAVIKDTSIKKVIDSRLDRDSREEVPKKADTEAAESVENTAYIAADTAYRKGKSTVKKSIKKRNSNRTETREQAESNTPAPQNPSNSEEITKDTAPKTSDTQLKTKDRQETSTNNTNKTKSRTKKQTVKTKNEIHTQKTPDSDIDKTTATEQAKQKAQIKTKENYLEQLRQERIEPKRLRTDAPKQNTHTVSRSTKNLNRTIKARKAADETVKQGSVYSQNAIKRKAAKGTKNAVKTQKEITKKAAKEAAKRAKQLAERAAKAAKAATRAAVKISIKIAQIVGSAAAKLISALAAAGGWAILIVVLIIVIVVAALAASPFGIFISDEVREAGTIPLSQIRAECNVELTEKVENIELSVNHDDVEVVDNQADWNEVIAVFAVKTAGTDDNTAEDVVMFDTAKAEKLKNVFRAANVVSYTTSSYRVGDDTKTKLTITITGKTRDELMSAYSFTAKQKEAVAALLENEDILTASSQSLAITDATVQGVVNGLPDSLPQKRKDVVKNAASLVGKVNYFWGGKSSAIGWDSAWGEMRRVSAEGSPSSGSIRAFGLDCSGFVTWVFNNSGMSVGHGTSGQKAASTLVSASTVQAGDLAFVSDYSHVGIVVGRDTSGNILVIHCSSGANNVVLATASSVRFNIFKRPSCY